MPIVILARLARPFWRLNFIQLRSDRAGHFIPDSVELIFSQYSRSTNIYFMNHIVCNTYWAQKISKKIIIFDTMFSDICKWNKFIPGEKFNSIKLENSKKSVLDNFAKTQTFFDFTKIENLNAKKFLGAYGWKDNEPFICFLNRDDSYLNSTQPHLKWDYHRFRNSNIRDYESAIKWIADQGIWILRMGQIQSAELKISHPKVIDYAFSKNKSDFLDIWLFANASGCISNSSGPDWISIIYGVPQLFINYLPMAELVGRSKCTVFPKKLTWTKNHKPLTLREILQNHHFQKIFYDEAGITITDLSSNEIKNAFQEFYHLIFSTKSRLVLVDPRIKLFFTIMRQWEGYSRIIGYNSPKGIPAKIWLDQQNSRFFG